MTGRSILDQLAHGPDTSFRGRLVVLAELEHLDGDGQARGIGVACRQLGGDAAGRDVLLIGRLLHWSAPVLACARPGDEIEVAGRAEAIDAGPQLAPTTVVVGPASLRIWRCLAAGPDAPNPLANPCGGAAA